MFERYPFATILFCGIAFMALPVIAFSVP